MSPENEGASAFSRYLLWTFLLLVLGLALFLSIVIGKRVREVMLEKHYAFASLLSDNLNHQIYRRYTLPMLLFYGRIDLSIPAQYERLDQLIGQAIHGLNVQELNIFDHGLTVTYSTDRLLLGRKDKASSAAEQAMNAQDPIFRIEMGLPFWRAFFQLSPEKNSFVLCTTSPLRAENRLSAPEGRGPLLGVLEFRQDITKDMLEVLHFQWSIIGLTLLSCTLIFSLLVALLRRVERALAARVEEKDRLRAELHQHERLAGMGRVIAGIAHEIRNPLGIIRSSADLLLRRMKNLDEGSRGILRAINDETLRLSATVSDFLDYARPRAPNREPVDLGLALEQAAAFFKPELDRRNISLRWESPENNLFMVYGDKELLYRALYNVLSNAAQALGAGAVPGISQDPGLAPPRSEAGEIRMEIAYAAPPPPPPPPATKKKFSDLARRLLRGGSPSAPAGPAPESEREISISIRDNGPGFATPAPRSCLEPFFTTKAGGSGLGLAIVDSIIRSHQGRLELGNVPEAGGHGARVRIFLPPIK
ncbi:MAG: two-component sensor histidine kinase [Deltaproteobacteria bacterium]|jgi:signal transduction histidine kinase|nr:two-component sensor histidine kinase [Deltaproteobacteria bacterium]